MQLFYTTKESTGAEQVRPNLSLGYFQSSTSPRNDDTGSLFDEISTLTLRRGKTEYIALMLQNTLGVTATGVNIWVEPKQTDSYSKFLIAGVIPTVDENGDVKMEGTRDKYAKPFIGDFVEATDISKLSLGDILDGDIIGLWFARELLVEEAKADQADVYEPDPDNERRFIPKEKSQEDAFGIQIEWT